MTRKVVGIIIAVLLALMGTVALVAYVSTAEERARAGEELVEVYVVTQAIAAGTEGSQVEQSVVVEQVPVKVRPLGAVDNLGELSGRVAAVDLLPGEQLVDSRFIEPSEFADRGAGVQVPEDMIEVTIQLEPQRAVGGLIEPGQTVAVLASFDPFQLSADVVVVDGEEVPIPGSVAEAAEGQTPNTTDLLLRKVLVTAVQEVQGGNLGEDGERASRLNTTPDGAVHVTLAVRPFDAERLVFTAEFGRIWLAIERDTVPEVDDPPQDRGTVYDDLELPQ